MPLTLIIEKNVPLQPYNSLSLPAQAEFFCAVGNLEDLGEALNFAKKGQLNVTPLGGGSNVVLSGDIDGLVIQLNLRGMSYAIEGAAVQVTFAAGENWHRAVITTLQKGWFGMENLSLIPGNMGAAPIQNIGAYGVELADLFHSLRAMEVATGKVVTFTKGECQFGYRDSLFKTQCRDQYIILDVTLSLTTEPQVNLSYPALRSAAEGHANYPNLTAIDVSELVMAIRRDKLPDPLNLPNAGSFFKNPVVSAARAADLLLRYPDMPHFAQALSQVKIPAAWLIDQCGFKGVIRGAVGVHTQQALVLVNFGGGTGQQLLALADEISTAVAGRFAIALELEPRVYGPC